MHPSIHSFIHGTRCIIGAGLSQLEVCLLIGAMVLTQPPHSFDVRALAWALIIRRQRVHGVAFTEHSLINALDPM
jgi:hypothetical protein